MSLPAGTTELASVWEFEGKFFVRHVYWDIAIVGNDGPEVCRHTSFYDVNSKLVAETIVNALNSSRIPAAT